MPNSLIARIKKLAYQNIISDKDRDRIIKALEQEPQADYKSFCEWVAEEIIDEEYWGYNADAFPEIACRKLHRLGIINTDGKRWIYENESIEQEPKTDRIEYGNDGNPYKLSISNGKEYEQEPILDKIRAEIDVARFFDKDTKLCKNANASGLEVAMQIIDKYRGGENMTKEEALYWLDTIPTIGEQVDALEMAIKALEQEQKIIGTIDFAINASDGDTNYFVGFRNGMRYVKSLIDGKDPQYESCAEQEPCEDCQYKEWLKGEIEPKTDTLDKIRAEIEKPLHEERFFDTANAKAQAIALEWCIEIIDKYRQEG